MSVIRRRYLDGPFGPIHLAAAGDGPPVVLLHQTPRSWDEFREVMELLADRFRLVAVDLPGMGGSQRHPDGASIEGYAEAAAAVIVGLDLGPSAVCGHHTGGVVAIELAASRPELVDRLVLSSTPWVDEEARRRRAGTSSIDTAVPRLDGAHLGSLWAQRAEHYPQRIDLLQRFMADALRTDDPASGHQAVSRYRMERAVTMIRCPAVIIEHSMDPFASVHTDELGRQLGDVPVHRIAEGQIALEATATEFAALLATILAA